MDEREECPGRMSGGIAAMRRVQPTRRTWIVGLGLALLLSAGFAADTLVLVTARAEAQVAVGGQHFESNLTRDRTDEAVPVRRAAPFEPPNHQPSSGSARATFTQRLSQGRPVRHDNWPLGFLAITVALAICGGIATAARRLSARNIPVVATVMSRICLSPKHTIYMVQIGRRVLLVGTGPQAAPALLGEVDDLSVLAPNLSEGGEA
jgi:hypothetical protein